MNILIIDDETATLESLSMCFNENGHFVDTAYNGKNGFDKLYNNKFELIILDIRLPDINGIDLLKKIKKYNNHIFVIMITAYHEMDTAVESMKYGAYDYIYKPIDIRELNEKIRKLDNNKNHNVNYNYNKDKLCYKSDYIIGNSKKMMDVYKTIGLCCNTRATVLINGETGTGKELIAKAIHNKSFHSNEPFITINCSSLVESLLESEIFGHEKGAFTNAYYTKEGKFELASNGTIFLDEISEIPGKIQVKLLRFLQDKSFERVGSNKTIKSNCRIIAASNKYLFDEVKEGRFREDLYYRLKIVYIDVPPLRERKDDIPFLAEYILEKYCNEMEISKKYITNEAMKYIQNNNWVGNVRELENTIMRLIILCKQKTFIDDDDINEICINNENNDMTINQNSLEKNERDYIIDTLKQCNCHKGKVCEILKISRPTLNNKIIKYNIELEDIINNNETNKENPDNNLQRE